MLKGKINRKIIFFNLISIIVILVLGAVVFNFVSFFVEHRYLYKIYGYTNILKNYGVFMNRKIDQSSRDDIFYSQLRFRCPDNIESELKPILLFGCSFVFGHGLEWNQTFSYKLSQITGRPVYNRAQGGWGVNHMVYQLSDPHFYEVVPEPEYIIYTFFKGQYSRMYFPICFFCDQCYPAFYKEEDNALVLKDRNFITDKFIPYNLYKSIVFDFSFKSRELEIEDFLIKHFAEAKKYQSERWPNSKFIIFFYDDPLGGKNTINRLEQMGYLTFSREDYRLNPYLEKYKLDDGPLRNNLSFHQNLFPSIKIKEFDYGHPSEEFWNDFVPILVENYNL